ncbi:MAG: citrate/2-methylcitrate synthase [Gemmataceae bacterium]
MSQIGAASRLGRRARRRIAAVSFIDGKNARLNYRGIAVEQLARQSCFEETAYLLPQGRSADPATTRRLRRSASPSSPDQVSPQGPHEVPAGKRALRCTRCNRAWPRWACSTRPATSATAEQLGVRRPPDREAADRRRRVSSHPSWRRADSAARRSRSCGQLLLHAVRARAFAFGSQGDRRLPHRACRAHDERLDVRRSRDRFDAGESLHGDQLGHRHAHRPAAWRSERRNARHASGDRFDRKPEGVDRRGPGQEKEVHGASAIAYKVKDPRATVLQDLAEHVFVETGRPARYDLAVAMEKEMAKILGPKGIFLNVDFYSGIVYEGLGIRAICLRRSSPSPASPVGRSLAGAVAKQPHSSGPSRSTSASQTSTTSRSKSDRSKHDTSRGRTKQPRGQADQSSLQFEFQELTSFAPGLAATVTSPVVSPRCISPASARPR